jgi:hypothetical protein
MIPVSHIINLFFDRLRPPLAYGGAALLLAAWLAWLLVSRRRCRNGVPSDPSPGEAAKLWPWLLAALAGVLLFWAPYLFCGADVHVKIFDNLDCHVPQTKVLAESGKAFSLDPDAKLDNFINGLPLSGVDSGWNVMTWLFMLLPPLAAYAANELLMRLAALLGMVLLLRRHLFRDGAVPPWLVAGVGLCFSLLPFYPAGGLSVTGLPLLLHAFLDIHAGRGRWHDFLIVLAFPFYSKLALAGFFIVVVLGLLFVVDVVRRRRFHWPFAWALALLGGGYGFTHFHLIYSFLNPHFTSFREEIRVLGIGTGRALQEALHNFVFDRVNEASAQQLFVIAAIALGLGLGALRRRGRRTGLLAGLVAYCLATSLLWGFKYWSVLMPLRERVQLLNAFDFSRFFWLNPLCWYLAFALALAALAEGRRSRWLAAALIAGQVLFLFAGYNWEYRSRLGLRASMAGSPLTYSLTWRQFFSPGLMADIQRHIHRPLASYRVVSLGIHPGIAQFSGFYTLDVYTDIYPLEYKHRFQRIIAPELAVSEELRRGFAGNAKRCYLMVAELHGDKRIRGLAFSRGLTKDEPLAVRRLHIDTAALKALGGRYILSAVPIVNCAENGLQLDGVFERPDSPWRIHLYRVRK